MKTSSHFKQALLRNLEKLNDIPTELIHSATIQGVYRKDYPIYKRLTQKKHLHSFRFFFLQKA